MGCIPVLAQRFAVSVGQAAAWPCCFGQAASLAYEKPALAETGMHAANMFRQASGLPYDPLPAKTGLNLSLFAAAISKFACKNREKCKASTTGAAGRTIQRA